MGQDNSRAALRGNGYVRPEQAARMLVEELEKRGYNFESSRTDREMAHRLPEVVYVLGTALGWSESYTERVARVARLARGRCGLPYYTDRTLRTHTAQ